MAMSHQAVRNVIPIKPRRAREHREVHSRRFLPLIDDKEAAERAFSQMEAAASLSFSPKLRQRIQTAAIELEHGNFDATAAARRLNHLVETARQLRGQLTEYCGTDEAHFLDITGSLPSELYRPIDRLIQTSGSEIARLRTKQTGGRRYREDLDRLIYQLADVFCEAGGRVAVGGGPFTRFLRAVWQYLPSTRPSAEALIRRAARLVPELPKEPISRLLPETPK